jgi:hypothetical protein
MQMKNCSLCYLFIMIGHKCTTFFEYTNKNDQKRAILLFHAPEKNFFYDKPPLISVKNLYICN